jgi:hypothetical protein
MRPTSAPGSPPRLSDFFKTPPIVFCPADIVTGISVKDCGVFEKGVSGGLSARRLGNNGTWNFARRVVDICNRPLD